MIDTLDSKRFDGLYALGSEESSVEGLGGLAGRDHAPHAGGFTGRDPRRGAASPAGQPSTRRGGTTRDTAPGRTRAVGRGAPEEEALEAA